MELAGPPDQQRVELLSVVTGAVRRRPAKGTPDCSEQATLLELAVLADNEAAAIEVASTALALVCENREPEATARNRRA
ncbi:MAG TPA: hypothetical protein PK440_20645 [Candidatus Accumulibacter phosphatis]|nr:hypothetical protein [Accumulibacter sp.]HCN69538.1 hypothetical protein [Accumulibacter sp.]HCV12517.1 hypothetical protein [Accumulibacter sp.]HRL77960.1 hypothetical protein [Candidatus Accumulibacter phosphatis]HRQ97370.1 hypothetical protein [Candidatus Accumulibacter phosphatis]